MKDPYMACFVVLAKVVKRNANLNPSDPEVMFIDALNEVAKLVGYWPREISALIKAGRIAENIGYEKLKSKISSSAYFEYLNTKEGRALIRACKDLFP
jgi:hypothetical protein